MKIVFVAFCLLQISWCKVDKIWWKYTTMYQVFLPSFKDGNGDGMGDLKGLTSKLDHFVDMGIETIYITPHYESPMVDSGYDVSNFTAINPIMGTMEDFEELIREMNVKELKLVIDLVFNHCSDQHPWFKKSIQREAPYTDFFIWRDPKGYDNSGNPIPPNNWINILEKSTWTWNDQRKQYYLHRFVAEQPDFNLRNKLVKNELKKIMKFWVEKGVAGFRFDATKVYLEDEQFRDEPPTSPDIKVPSHYADLEHIYTTNLPESYEVLYEFRRLLEKSTRKYNDFERIFVTEDYINGALLYKYYGSKDRKISHIPINFILTITMHYANASYLHEIINKYLNGLPEGAVPNWNTENHDKGRKGYQFGEDYGFLFTAMEMMLPGMLYLYYGQEISATGSYIRPDQVKNHLIDPIRNISRDYFRQPMPWDDSLNGGFSTNNQINLPLNPNYWKVNVKRQKEDPHSYYHVFKILMNLRKTNTLKLGDFKSYVLSTWVFGFARALKGHATYFAIFNLGSETEFIDLYNNVDNLPELMTVEAASPNSGYKIGDEVSTMQKVPIILILRPGAMLVLGTKIPYI